MEKVITKKNTIKMTKILKIIKMIKPMKIIKMIKPVTYSQS